MDRMTIDLYRRVADLERRLDGLVKPEVPGWADWTPTVTQSVAVTITINYARQRLENGKAICAAEITTTTAGTAGNNIIVGGLPHTLASTNSRLVLGAGSITDVTVQLYNSIPVPNTTTSIQFRYDGGSFVGTNPSFALANGDRISFVIIYEVA